MGISEGFLFCRMLIEFFVMNVFFSLADFSNKTRSIMARGFIFNKPLPK